MPGWTAVGRPAGNQPALITPEAYFATLSEVVWIWLAIRAQACSAFG